MNFYEFASDSPFTAIFLSVVFFSGVQSIIEAIVDALREAFTAVWRSK